MKRFIKYSLFGFLFIILFGCANEMRVVSFNVTQKKTKHFYEDADFNPSDYFNVTIMDNIGTETEIQCAGIYKAGQTQMAGGYYYMEWLEGGVATIGPWKIRLLYYPGGRFYNYGQLYTKEVTINVIKREDIIDQVGIEKIKLNLLVGSRYLAGNNWLYNLDNHYFAGNLTIIYPEESGKPSIQYNLNDIYSSLTMSGIDENTPVGVHLITATFLGHTSEPVSLTVIRNPVQYTESTITYYDHSTDLHLSPSTYTSIEEVDLPVYIDKPGYDFGWCTTVDKSGDATGDPIKKIPYGSIENFKLYPKWTLIPYEIKYNNVKDAANGNRNSYTIEDNVELKQATKSGYTFNGWYEIIKNYGNSDTSTDGWNAGDRTGDVTFYAKWTLNHYNISYRNLKAAANDNPASYTIKKNIVLKDLTADGFTFGGWYEVVNDITSDTSTAGWNAGDRTGDVTLYAKWNQL